MDPKGFWSSYFKFCLLILLHLYQLLPKVSSSVLLLIDSAACCPSSLDYQMERVTGLKEWLTVALTVKLF